MKRAPWEITQEMFERVRLKIASFYFSHDLCECLKPEPWEAVQ